MNTGLVSATRSMAGVIATGPMQFTRIPSGPHSWARLFAKPRWAAFTMP